MNWHVEVSRKMDTKLESSRDFTRSPRQGHDMWSGVTL
ncbi:hypothetical protein MPQ_0525 [Methylovorus sp. MP688]|nr:hypothetical protein MPQ_0525 [Methylovorus sp. MP688]